MTSTPAAAGFAAAEAPLADAPSDRPAAQLRPEPPLRQRRPLLGAGTLVGGSRTLSLPWRLGTGPDALGAAAFSLWPLSCSRGRRGAAPTPTRSARTRARNSRPGSSPSPRRNNRAEQLVSYHLQAQRRIEALDEGGPVFLGRRDPALCRSSIFWNSAMPLGWCRRAGCRHRCRCRRGPRPHLQHVGPGAACSQPPWAGAARR